MKDRLFIAYISVSLMFVPMLMAGCGLVVFVSMYRNDDGPFFEPFVLALVILSIITLLNLVVIMAIDLVDDYKHRRVATEKQETQEVEQ
jgi:hypothetical protein